MPHHLLIGFLLDIFQLNEQTVLQERSLNWYFLAYIYRFHKHWMTFSVSFSNLLFTSINQSLIVFSEGAVSLRLLFNFFIISWLGLTTFTPFSRFLRDKQSIYCANNSFNGLLSPTSMGCRKEVQPPGMKTTSIESPWAVWRTSPLWQAAVSKSNRFFYLDRVFWDDN